MSRESKIDAELKVSIVLPTFNRAKFLPQAIEAITAQQWTDWELIIVDDGSTDETCKVVTELTAAVKQPVTYIRQENKGAYGARNAGLDRVRGRYVAFYDSDDQWLPHHLKNCVIALEDNADVDWVYGACQVVNDATSCIVAENTFYHRGRPRPFLKLRTRRAGSLRIIDDRRVLECMILHGTYSGLQNSVFRRAMFNDNRFEAARRNEAEDQLTVVRALVGGRRLAYFDAVHVIYHVHGQNSSAAGSSPDLEKERRVLRLMAEGYERVGVELNLAGNAKRAMRRRLGRLYFWALGYSLFWQHGDRDEALTCFRNGLRHWPWQPTAWKTYAIATWRTRNAAQEAL